MSESEKECASRFMKQETKRIVFFGTCQSAVISCVRERERARARARASVCVREREGLCVSLSPSVYVCVCVCVYMYVHACMHAYMLRPN